MERAVPNLPADDLHVAKDFYVGKLGFSVMYEATEDGMSGVMSTVVQPSPQPSSCARACVTSAPAASTLATTTSA
jgi:hypothetical protein